MAKEYGKPERNRVEELARQLYADKINRNVGKTLEFLASESFTQAVAFFEAADAHKTESGASPG